MRQHAHSGRIRDFQRSLLILGMRAKRPREVRSLPKPPGGRAETRPSGDNQRSLNDGSPLPASESIICVRPHSVGPYRAADFLPPRATLLVKHSTVQNVSGAGRPSQQMAAVRLLLSFRFTVLRYIIFVYYSTVVKECRIKSNGSYYYWFVKYRIAICLESSMKISARVRGFSV